MDEFVLLNKPFLQYRFDIIIVILLTTIGKGKGKGMAWIN